ncbi:MAG: hypothetical protein ACOWW1_05685 [archaeon]
MVQLDLDVFVDQWSKKGQGYVWIQKGSVVPIPEVPEEFADLGFSGQLVKTK